MEELQYDERVHVIIDVKLPSLIKYHVVEQAKRLLERSMHHYHNVGVQMHVKPDGPQIGCNLTLHTEDGKFHAHVIDWDVRKVVMDTVDSVELQLQKHWSRVHVHA